MSNSLSVYEDWVRALRAWRRDPLVDLSHLPALDEASFPPATYQRFLNHLNEAINEFMKRWQSQLSTSLGAATDDHVRARALVDSRLGLSQRLRLARHASFPEKIRNELVAQAEKDIRGLQAQLEENALNVVAVSSASSRPQREATLRLIRDNALTAVLDPNFSLDGTINDKEALRADAVTEESGEAASTTFQDFVPRRPIRRIFNSNQQE